MSTESRLDALESEQSKHARRLDALEFDHGSLLRATTAQTTILDKQTTILETLQESVGKAPNPFGATREAKEGSGLMRIAIEMNDARRFSIKLIAIVATGTAAIITVIEFLRSVGAFHLKG